MPPELGTEPALPPGVEVEPLAVPPPLELLPLVMPSSFRHFSRSAPVMPRHLALVLPEAPLLPDTPPDALLPAEPLPEVPEELLPAAPALLPAPPPDVEPELCASETLDSAKSAAAVAALMSFNVIGLLPPYLLLGELLLPEPLLEPELGVLGVLGLLGLGVLLLPDAPPLEELPLEPEVPPLDAAPDLPIAASHS